MKLVLDTHIVLWWLFDDPRLRGEQRAAVEQAEARGDRLEVSAITLWEIAKLVERGRIVLDSPVDDVLESIEASPTMGVVPLSPRICAESTRLGPEFPRDPADQLIAATARIRGARLVTADGPIRASGAVGVV